MHSTHWSVIFYEMELLITCQLAGGELCVPMYRAS